MVQYADDTSLLVPQNHNVTLEDEFENIKQWAKSNKLTINLSKTKELVFHRPNPIGFIPPPPLKNIERVTFASLQLLGVFVVETLGASKKIKYILQLCNHLLNQLKKQGLARKQLLNVFNAIVVSRITAAAWGGRDLQALQKLILFIYL